MRAKRSGCSAAVLLLSLFLSAEGMAASEQVIYAFSECGQPAAPLIADASGSLYGTTADGGIGKAGCVFKMVQNPDTSWSETLLYSFQDRASGPIDGLTLDKSGNLYGAAGGGLYGGGVVYQLSPSPSGEWVQTVLYNFSWPEGNGPSGEFFFDNAGNIYGTTSFGGAHRGGTVFKLSPGPNGWTLTTLHSFWGAIGGPGGDSPVGGLVMDQAGNFFGVTFAGGKYGYGTVYELKPKNGGYAERLIHSFNGYDGALPGSGLVTGPDGNLYGTTIFGGAVDCGTAFQLKKGNNGKWTESVLYSLGNDGCMAVGPVAFDDTGNLYGAAQFGGLISQGEIFKLTPKRDGSWKASIVHRFHYLNSHYKPGTDGANPYAGVIVNRGVMYGTTASGGVNDAGTVFSITPR